MRTFSVKNFERFQHYKDRAPPWIKLYNELLEDYDFGALPDTTKAHLTLIWLLASRMDNKLPFDPRWIGAKINATEPVDLDALAAAGFIVPYDEATAKGKREDWPSRYIPESVKAAVLLRDGNKCRACNSTDNLEIDHVIPVSKGGAGTADNLQVLCRSCNRKKRATLASEDRSVAAEQVATQMRSPPEKLRSREREGEAETEGEKGSVSNETASRDATDPIKALFAFGRQILVEAGRTPNQAGSILGKWRKDSHDDAWLMSTLVQVKKDNIQDPVAYVTAAISRKGKPSGLYGGAMFG